MSAREATAIASTQTSPQDAIPHSDVAAGGGTWLLWSIFALEVLVEHLLLKDLLGPCHGLEGCVEVGLKLKLNFSKSSFLPSNSHGA